MATIDNVEINEIQKSANIVDIISSYIELTKKGKNYFGMCPFHDDHNPSMSVSEDKGIYTCFVCHKTGNVFSFVQDYEGISFIEAVKVVADKVGIELQVSGVKASSKYDKHYEAVSLATKLYQNNIRSSEGKKAYDYLIKRGINDEIIDEFQIGYANSSADTVTKLLLNKNFDEKILLETGLSNQGNTLYDLFRDRITFTIHDIRGNPVGFSARIYENKDEAKYINTKETPIFKKGEILFNYHRAKTESKKLNYIILVEGQMDAIRVYSSGIKNVVATMGTALTINHVNLLKKLNVPVILCMDNDAAGEKATLANGELLSNNGVEVKVVRLSGAKDPDEYILANGAEKYLSSIENAIFFFDFKLNALKHNKNLGKVDELSKYINDVVNELNKVSDPILIDLTINNLVKEYGIDKNILLNKIIKVEKTDIKKVEVKESVRKNKNEKLMELLLFYMINDIKYIKLYEQELSYLPNELYDNIASDILAFYLKYNYINIADFITYEIESNYYEKVLDIIDNNINASINDQECIGLVEKIKSVINENKIIELKEKLKNTTDINEKLKITDEIAKMKRKMCEV